MTFESLYWEDVREGQELPAITRDITPTMVISCAIASRDFTPLHHEREFAQKLGLKDIFINTHTIYGLAGKYLTDWSGPGGELKEIALRLMMPCFAGDSLTITGKAVKKYVAGDDCCVELEFTFAVPSALNCTGKAKMVLPARSASRERPTG